MNRKQFLLTLSVAIISAFLGGTLGVWFLMPPSVLAQDGVPEVIEAQEFRVVDANGDLRGYFSLEGVTVLGATKGVYANLTVNSDGTPAVTLSGANDTVATLEVSDSNEERGGPRLELIDLDDKRFIIVGLTKTDAQVIAANSEGNQAQFGLAGELPRLRLDSRPFQEEGGETILMFVQPEGSVLAMTKGDKLTTRLGDDHLYLFDDEQRPRAVLGTTELKHPDTGSTEIRAPSSIVLFDEEGKVVWSAP